MNPIAYARITDRNKSQNRLSKELGIDRSYLVRVENGMFAEPSALLISYASRVLQIPESEVIARYKRSQELVRNSTVEFKVNLEPINLDLSAPINQEFNRAGQAFRRWRESHWQTVNQFCKDMCLHPASVSGYEDGSIATMPKQLREVLNEFMLLP